MKVNLKVEQPKSLTEIVFDRLRQAIVDGEFAFGENISEIKLAKALGVSRTPVRDALFQLQMQGLVCVQPKRGSFVFEPTEKDVIAICEFRYMLETHAVQLSIQRNHKKLLRHLNHIINEMSDALDEDDVIEYSRTDSRFHQTFFDFCDNSYVQDSFQLADGRIAVLRTLLTTPRQERLTASFDEHKRITSLILEKDIAALKTLFREHIDRNLTAHLEALRKNGISE